MKYVKICLLVVSSAVFSLCADYNAEKSILVVIPSYNNQQWYQMNLHSVVCQKYSNYRVIYVNDCSTDDTGQLVRAYIDQMGCGERITLINNNIRCGALANLYRIIHTCDDNTIIVTLDGDDFFADDNVLARINAAYQDENVWLTYGQFKTYPQNTVGFCREMPQGIIRGNLFREYEWITSHPRTFYAGLFKQIKLKDLLYEGSFFDVTWDAAFMYPMLEMAAEHIRFIPDVLYVYNQDNVLNDFRQKVVRQLHCKYLIASKNKYAPIKTFLQNHDHDVDILIFSDNDPENLMLRLENIKRFIEGSYKIKVLYRSFGNHRVALYSQLQNSYKTVSFYQVGEIPFKQLITNVFNDINSAYVLLIADDELQLSEICDLRSCVNVLNQTKAHAVYCALGKDSNQALPPMVVIENGFLAWQFKDASFEFKQPFSMNMTLYKKETLQRNIAHIAFHDPEYLMQMLNSMRFDYDEIGICSEYRKAKRIYRL